MHPRQIKLCGQDPSLRNWGLALGTLDVDTMKLSITDISVICPVLPKGKQIRQNSLDIEAAYQLYMGAMTATEGVQAIFAEVPVGSQSA